MKFDVVVVGAGISGCVFAHKASQLGLRVLIIEQRSHIAGNCFDEKAEMGIIVHRYGPHLFHTSNFEIFQFLSQFTDWVPYEHRVLGSVDGALIPIPFNFQSLEILFGNQRARDLESKLLDHFEWGAKVPILKLKAINEPHIQKLAQFVYEKIFLNYTTKQWGVRPEEIDQEVTARVPIRLSRDDRYFDDRFQCVPREGYTQMIHNMINVPKISLLLRTNYREVLQFHPLHRSVKLFDHDFHGVVVYTGMIDELFEYQFGELPYRGLDFRFETHGVDWYQKTATVNYPNQYTYTRITEFKHIHPTLEAIQRTIIVKEFPKPYRRGDVPYYPVFDQPSRQKYEQYAELAAQWRPKLILLGRLAEYRYYDMDDAVERALAVFQENEHLLLSLRANNL